MTPVVGLHFMKVIIAVGDEISAELLSNSAKTFQTVHCNTVLLLYMLFQNRINSQIYLNPSLVLLKSVSGQCCKPFTWCHFLIRQHL